MSSPRYHYVVNELLLDGANERLVNSTQFRAAQATLSDCKKDAQSFYNARLKLVEYRLMLGIYEKAKNQIFELDITLVETHGHKQRRYLIKSVNKTVQQSALDYEEMVLQRYPDNVHTWNKNKPVNNTDLLFSPVELPGTKQAGFIDYYDVLGVPFDATGEEIELAYKTLEGALQSSMMHPDWHPGKNTYQQMRQLNDAYMVLNDTRLRTDYDKEYVKNGSKDLLAKNKEATIATTEKQAEPKTDIYDVSLKTDQELLDIDAHAAHFSKRYITEVKTEIEKRKLNIAPEPVIIHQPSIIEPKPKEDIRLTFVEWLLSFRKQ